MPIDFDQLQKRGPEYNFDWILELTAEPIAPPALTDRYTEFVEADVLPLALLLQMGRAPSRRVRATVTVTVPCKPGTCFVCLVASGRGVGAERTRGLA